MDLKRKSKISRNTAQSVGTIKDATVKNQENFTLVNDLANYNDAEINAASGEADSVEKASRSYSKTEPQVSFKISSTKTHDIQTAEVIFNESGSEETSL